MADIGNHALTIECLERSIWAIGYHVIQRVYDFLTRDTMNA